LSEHTEQRALVEWAGLSAGRRPELSLLFAIPNGGARSKATAGRLRAEGVRAGVPDLCLPVSRRGYHGLFIEMKMPKRKPTSAQRGWHEALTEQGYRVDVCEGFEAARDRIEWYLGLPHVKKTFYRHKGELMGYGIKVWPEALEATKEKAPEVENLEGL